MKITSITIRRNRANPCSKFEHKHVEMTATLDEGDTEADVLMALENKVENALRTQDEREFTRLLASINNLGSRYGEAVEAIQELEPESRPVALPAMRLLVNGGTLKEFYKAIGDL